MSIKWASVHFPCCFQGDIKQQAWLDSLFFFPSVVFSCLPFCLNDLQTSLSLCESVGLGCYWVDYSELWKWKRTSLTFTNSGNSSLCFPLQCCPSAFIKKKPTLPLLLPKSAHLILHLCVVLASNALYLLICIHRTAVPQWQPPPKATPHKTSGDSLHLGTPEQLVPQPPGRSCWGFTPHRLLLPLEYMHWEAQGRQGNTAEADAGPRLVDAINR